MGRVGLGQLKVTHVQLWTVTTRVGVILHGGKESF